MKTCTERIILIFFVLAFSSISAKAQTLSLVEKDVSSKVLQNEKFADLGLNNSCISTKEKYSDGCVYIIVINNCSKPLKIWWATERKDGTWARNSEELKVGKPSESARCSDTGRYIVLSKNPDDYVRNWPTDAELKNIFSK